ncbi:uncharacterized protein FIBRA_03239 [Fibroporia radiculosa]|uniref:Small ribosomal subunit protein uS7 domain-containing protein n=1 Tax=Fibroporia radiculosa TaxID=599839 RepID=J4I9H9_9APHY|nr:uncharacterized protein FIBRA_03239 [Fibroporia radiculosa]CCM01191.1 predicted protein [Fibroporia radiculosa]
MLRNVTSVAPRTWACRATGTSRWLATAPPSASDASILNDTLSTVGGLLNSNLPIDIPLSSPPQPVTPRLHNSNAPPVINIPPPEDPLLSYFTSCIQKHGNRQKAAGITSRMLLHIHTMTRAQPLPIVRKAIENVAPAVRCISNKHAGKTVVYPVALSEKQRTRYAIQWILKASESKPGMKLEERLAKEIIAAVQSAREERSDRRSAAFLKKEEVHKYAMMNRGNAQRGG